MGNRFLQQEKPQDQDWLREKSTMMHAPSQSASASKLGSKKSGIESARRIDGGGVIISSAP